MRWVETEMSTDGSHWSLENDLEIDIRLVNRGDRYTARIAGSKWEMNGCFPLDEAKQFVMDSLEVRLTNAMRALNELMY